MIGQETEQVTKPTIKNKRKLIRQVNSVLSLLAEDEVFIGQNFKVVYKLDVLETCIYVPTIKDREPMGYTQYYNWSLIDKLVELSDKETISYNIGLDVNLELHIQIFI